MAEREFCGVTALPAMIICESKELGVSWYGGKGWYFGYLQPLLLIYSFTTLLSLPLILP